MFRPEFSAAIPAQSAPARRFVRRASPAVAALSPRDRRESEAWMLERRKTSQAERDAWARDHQPND